MSTATDVSVDDIDFDTEGMFGQCRILDDRLEERCVDGLAQGDPLSGISIVLKDCAGMSVVYCYYRCRLRRTIFTALQP